MDQPCSLAASNFIHILPFHFSWGVFSSYFVSVLNDYATRWKALHLQSLEDSPLPLLCFGGWDSLRRAYFRKLVDWPQNRTIPWAQLTHLQICADMSCQQATSILGRCSKLVQLSIRVGDTNLVTANHVTLHDLVTFSVKSYHLSEILGALSLPSLRDLHLYDLSSTDLPSLLNLLTRSSCTLDTLAVHERFPLLIHDRLSDRDITSASYITGLVIFSLRSGFAVARPPGI